MEYKFLDNYTKKNNGEKYDYTNEYKVSRNIVYGILANANIKIKDDKIYFQYMYTDRKGAEFIYGETEDVDLADLSADVSSNARYLSACGQNEININNLSVYPDGVFLKAEQSAKAGFNGLCKMLNVSPVFMPYKDDPLKEEPVVEYAKQIIQNVSEKNQQAYMERIVDNFDSVINCLRNSKDERLRDVARIVSNYWNDNENILRNQAYNGSQLGA